MDKLYRRVALVTGGTRGIGRETVRQLAKNGFCVAFCYSKSVDESTELIAELLAGEVNACAYKCDVSDYEAVQLLKNQVNADFGFVDTIINNAGIEHTKLFTLETSLDFDTVIGVNLKGAFNICKAFVPNMIASGYGRIINISSIWGEVGASLEVLYSAAKAGLIGFTKALAKELAPSNITVNAVSPGIIDTKMNEKLSAQELSEFLSAVPISRLGTVEEVASAILFLAQENSGYITGQVLSINGGY